jgi:hypothetical protein
MSGTLQFMYKELGRHMKSKEITLNNVSLHHPTTLNIINASKSLSMNGAVTLNSFIIEQNQYKFPALKCRYLIDKYIHGK